MKFQTHIFGLILIAVLSMSCKDSVNFEVDDLQFSVSEGKLTVINKGSFDIYYFMADRDALASIFWVPVSNEENRIEALSKKELALSEIIGYSEESEELSFHYWASANPESDDINQIIIPLKD